MAVRDDFEVGEVLKSEDLNDTFAAKADKSAGYQFVQTVYFTSSGTFTKATYPWLRAVRVRCVGGGGAGGGRNTTTAGQVSKGGGGGGGGYAESFITDIAGMSASVTVTVGAGGTGVIANNGNAGSASSFGSDPVSAGGGAGLIETAKEVALPGPGGLGGLGSTGDILGAGWQGLPALSSTAIAFRGLSGAGGNSVLGRGGAYVGISSSTANSGSVYGGGGGGAYAEESIATTAAGGSGAAGIVIVELYA